MKRHTVDVHNLLVSLAWLGELQTDHVRRLCMPDRTPVSTQVLLRGLRAEGIVERRLWSCWSATNATPLRRPALWALTRRGRELVRESAQFPPEYKEPRARRMASHDAHTVETVVRVIELARALGAANGLSGLYVEREVRLDPARRQPVMDALIIVTLGGAAAPPHTVPWSRDPRIAGEQRVRYALENDRDTEPLTVIAGKAHAYQHAGTPAWERRYGRFPLPLWLVPSEARLRAVMDTWARAWPVGKWLITTDDWLRGDCWIEYDAGTTRERGLFHRTPRRPETP